MEGLKWWKGLGGSGIWQRWGSDSGPTPSEMALGWGGGQPSSTQPRGLLKCLWLQCAEDKAQISMKPPRPGEGEPQMDSPLLHIQRDLFLTSPAPFPCPPSPAGPMWAEGVLCGVSRGQRGAAKGSAWRTEGAPRRRREPEGKGSRMAENQAQRSDRALGE